MPKIEREEIWIAISGLTTLIEDCMAVYWQDNDAYGASQVFWIM